MKSASKKKQSFLTRLRRDEGGTTLAMMAAALIPIAGMIGSGLDMSRAYMAKAKLQNACDAAALAVRRHMQDELTDEAEDEGEKFFYFNFPRDTMGTAEVDLDIDTNPANASEVTITASTTVPTSVMQLFGKDTIAIAAECDADQDFVNNDIMLVLDVTMSMNCTAGTTCAYAASEQSNSRLSRLRNGAAGLYRALSDAEGVRTRYGIVPYSMTVNVGRPIRALNSSYIRNPADYWYQETYCSRYNNNGSCRTWSQRWSKRSVNHSSSWFGSTSSWTGCVEERSTISQNGQNEIRISTDVTKADIDTVSAADSKLQWQPYDANTSTATANYSDSIHTNLASFCPAAATRLTEYSSESQFQTAINNALSRVGGYTNHDLGIMWGMRFLSSSGMFATDNPREWAVGSGPLMPVEKHIVFMTDGVMSSPSSSYSSYGHHAADTRLIGSGSAISRHQERFLNACRLAEQSEEAGGHGITIWVIALDVQASGDISPCSGSGHFYVSNGSDLEQIFELIGKGIGKLRITK
ncbi:MAG: TadE/TadG family type IV pilus assembly protein [Allosphingosinicella sp.]